VTGEGITYLCRSALRRAIFSVLIGASSRVEEIAR